MYVLYFCRLLKRAAGALLCLALTLGVAHAQSLSLDLLERPAPENPQASRAVLMDVTRAGDSLVAVGERGLVLRSTDNGKTWRQIGVPVSVALTGVHFADGQHGWIIGHSGVVLYSANGGISWQRQLDGRMATQLEATAAERGDDTQRRRNAERLLVEGADKPWLDALFLDARHGWLVGAYGLLLRTEDGGVTWQSAMGDIDNPAGLHLYSIRALGKRLVIAGEQGALFQSTDNGQHFKRIESPYEGSFFGLASTLEGHLIAYGLRGNAWRQPAGTDDWQAISMGNDVTLTADLQVSNGVLLLADEAGRISFSRDGAGSFKSLEVVAKGYVAGLAEAADGAVIAVGARGVQRIESSQVQP